MERVLELPTRHPGWVVLVTLVISVFFVSRIVDLRTGEAHLRVDPSTEGLLPDGDQSREFYAKVRHQFRIQDTLVMALVMDDVFKPENLKIVKSVTELIGNIDGVRRVVSLANAPNVRGAAGDIEITPFLEQLPQDRDAIEKLRSDVFENPLYAGNLVSHDSRATALVVHLRDMPEQEFIDQALDERIREVAVRASGDAAVWLTGPPRIKAATTRLIFSSLSLILPISFGIMALIGLLSFRSFRGVLVPIGTVLLALIWTLGVVAWVRLPLNVVTTIVPPLLLTVGFAYAVHVVSEYYQALREDRDRVAASGGPAAWALHHVALPVALTGLTTAAGFLSLTISDFPAVREFGWISVLGIVVTALLSLTFVPAALELFGVPGREPRAGNAERLLDRHLGGLGRFDVRQRVPILFAGGLLALVSLAGMTRIEINTDLISNFKADHPVRRDFEAINESLQGAMPLEIILEANSIDAFADPANLEIVESLQEWLSQQPEVGSSTSFVDHIKVINRAFHDGDASYLAIPANARLTKQLLLFGASEEIESFVDRGYRTTRLQVRSSAGDSKEIGALASRIEQHLGTLPDHLRAHVTGDTVLLARAIDTVAQGQIRTLSLAFLFIYGILVLLFTSFRMGLLALIPNVLPVLLYFGVLGLTGISLNTTTGLFACIVLGIAVDDTIHFLTRFNVEARERVDERTGAVFALQSVGRPVTITTIALCLGFLALTTSELRGQVEFGALGGAILAFAWAVDVTFTPALCAGVRIVTLWDALTYDLGKDPQRSIPVLRGLSKAQARITALMTSIDTFPAGASIFRAGEPGTGLFVVVDGEMVVWVERGGRRIELSRAKRGDVVGEVALYAGGERTANVDALTDLRVLRLNEQNLRRLRNRYPRIGARVFWNLSEILATRLANVTERLT